MPAVGEVWLTRYGLKVRLIADTARGPYPLVGLIEWLPNTDKAWLYSAKGINCDPCDDGLDLVELIGTTSIDWASRAQSQWDEHLRALHG